MEQIIITTMCALINNNDEILFIDREKSWKGLALPGGHIEANESVTDCVIREIYEETGLIPVSLKFKGISHFFNNDITERYIVFNFVSHDFQGELKESCAEGSLKWIHRSELNNIQFAEGMELRFDLFFNDSITEMYVEWNQQDGYLKVDKNPL